MNIIGNSITTEIQAERRTTEDLRAEVEDRRCRRMAFWMGVMELDPEVQASTDKEGFELTPSYNDRLRASELAAKADGDFVSRVDVNVTATYREMIMTRAGRLEELAPAADQMMIDADVVEELILEESADDKEYALVDA